MNEGDRADVVDVTFSAEDLQEIVGAVVEARTWGGAKKVAGGPVGDPAGPLANNRRLADRVIALSAAQWDIWFFGDLHGDLLALEAGIHYIQSVPAQGIPLIVLLGDLVDDEGDAYALAIRVLRLLQTGRSIVWIAGNHDEALQWHPEGRFTAAVSPGDFADWLNGLSTPLSTAVGRCFVESAARAPRALFFEDGLLAAHGGFPHADLLPTLDTAAALGSAAALQDFVWTRAHRGRRKQPNRHSKGCQYGYVNFHEFRARTGELGIAVERVVRGHDHEEQRFRILGEYPLLTINSLTHRLPREGGGYFRNACIARYRANELPQVHRLCLPEDVVRRVYPEPGR
jgi:hypothetical protein